MWKYSCVLPFSTYVVSILKTRAFPFGRKSARFRVELIVAFVFRTTFEAIVSLLLEDEEKGNIRGKISALSFPFSRKQVFVFLYTREQSVSFIVSQPYVFFSRIIESLCFSFRRLVERFSSRGEREREKRKSKRACKNFGRRFIYWDQKETKLR